MPDDFDFSPNAKRKRDASLPPTTPLLTQTLCFLCVLITLAHFTTQLMPGTFWDTLGKFGVVHTSDIWDGKLYGLFTSFFVHLSIAHILFNMMWLWQLGAVLETTLVAWKYFLFMLGACFVGSCCEIALSGQTGAGASGVVYAMFGLMWAGRGSMASWRFLATRQNYNIFILWGLFCIFLTYSHIMAIANGAHWGGFAYGLAIGYLFYAPRRRPIWWVALGLLGVISVMSLVWLPWSWQWWWDRAGIAYGRKDYPTAIRGYELSLKLGGDPNPLKENIADAWDEIANDAEARHDDKTAADARLHADNLRETTTPEPKTNADSENVPPTENPARPALKPQNIGKQRSGQK